MKRFCEDLFRACRATGVLVATLVGAGYATGREMSQYFGIASIWTLVFAAVLIALFSMAFLYVGRYRPQSQGKFVLFYRVALSILAVVSCGVMVAAGKSLLSGVWTPILICLAGVFICFTDTVFHVANVLAVPVLIILVAVVAVLSPNLAIGTAFLPLSAANYAGMNLLFEGELLRQEGRDMRPRAILMAGVLIAVCMSLLLFAMHRVVGASSSELPFADVADGLGLRHRGVYPFVHSGRHARRSHVVEPPRTRAYRLFARRFGVYAHRGHSLLFLGALRLSRAGVVGRRGGVRLRLTRHPYYFAKKRSIRPQYPLKAGFYGNKS